MRTQWQLNVLAKENARRRVRRQQIRSLRHIVPSHPDIMFQRLGGESAQT